jgi:hypothetical protein
MSGKGEYPMNVCGAKTRQGSKCKNKAGKRTDHVGEGKCYLHGGSTPIKHGRESKVGRARLQEKIGKFKQIENPLDLFDEVAELRAFAEDLMERWDAIYGPDGALLTWHESFKKGEEESKPRHLLDFSSVTSVIDRVGVMVDRIQKHKAEGTITLTTLNRVVEQLGEELVYAAHEVKLDAATSTKLFEAVERRWHSVRLEPRKSRD